ncbi:accessory gene regulator ArgB-like protein [Amedibacillus sp. YH-ame10]
MNIVINKILQYMHKNHLVEDEDIELYQYGIYLMFLKLMHYCSILALGFLLGRVWELLIFLLCYTLLRSYTGGYHAKHEFTCLLISIAMILCIHLTIDRLSNVVIFGIVLLSVAFILLFAPHPTKEKIIEEDEMKRNHKVSIILTALLFLAFITTFLYNLTGLYYSIGYSLFYSSFYLVLAKGMSVKGRETNE